MDRILGASLDDLRRSRTSIKWQTYGPDVLPAWVAEMDVLPCPAVVDAVSAALRRGDTGYTWIKPYAVALADYAGDRWGWAIDPEMAVAVPDVMIGVLDVLRVLTDEGDTVVVSPPVYNAFFGFITGYGRRVVEAPLGADDRLDPQALRTAFASARAGGRRAAYLLCNPHNPTGTVHTRAELEMLAGLAEEFGVRVVADEIHAFIVYPGAAFTPYLSVSGGQRGISLISASKAWNLAGLKCGLAVPGAAAVADLARVPEVARHGASHVSAIAHAAALSDGRDWLDQLVVELDANRRTVAARLAAIPGVVHQPPESTYLAWLDLLALGLGDNPAPTVLARGRVALGQGPTFGSTGRGFARLNFATSPEVLDEILDRLEAALAGALPAW